MKIAFFSGTFDPAHLGHQALVDEVLAQGLADTVFVVPEESPWRKKPTARFSDRLAMAKATFAETPSVTVLDGAEIGLKERHDVG